MSLKITPDHLGRAAVVYIRQSTLSQVVGNLESQRRQYGLVEAATAAGFAAVTVIDGRFLAHIQGWYAQREFVQLSFIALVAMTCLVAAITLLIWARHAPIPTWLALIGATLVLGLVLIRARHPSTTWIALLEQEFWVCAGIGFWKWAELGWHF